jgi:hypothetical protein
VVEASLHETSDPRDPIDPKHHVLARLGVLDQVEWLPTQAIYEVRGGPIGEPFVLPEGFAQAGARLWGVSPRPKPVSALYSVRWNEFLWRSEL